MNTKELNIREMENVSGGGVTEMLWYWQMRKEKEERMKKQRQGSGATGRW